MAVFDRLALDESLDLDAWKESVKRLLVRVTPLNRPWSHLLSSLLSPRQRPCDDSSVP